MQIYSEQAVINPLTAGPEYIWFFVLFLPHCVQYRKHVTDET